MKKKNIFLFSVFLIFLFILGCDKKSCESELFTEDGKCCTYVCDKTCPYGYEKGTCNCECEESSYESEDMNIDDLFEDTRDVQPPVLPIP